MKSLPPQVLKCCLHDWATLRSQLLFTFDSSLPAGSVDGAYERPNGEYSAQLIRRGWFHLDADGDEVTARPGQWLFCLGKKIRQQASPDFSQLTLRLGLSWPDGTLMFRSRKSCCLLEASEHPQLEITAKKLLADGGHVEWRIEDPAYTFQWSVRLDHLSYSRHQRHLLEWTELVADVLGKKGWELCIPGGVDSRLAAVLFVLDTLPVNEPFPAKNSIIRSSLTLGQLNRMCQKAYGTTLYGHWEQRRVKHAKFLLEDAGASVKAVASELGFSQLSHFSAWFKRHTSLSPREFRQNTKGKNES